MPTKVYTYNNPKTWEQHPLFDTIKNEIHITATKNLAEGIKERYRSKEKEQFQYIFTIRQVLQSVFGKWCSDETVLAQYLELSRAINEINDNKNLKNAFKNNASEVLETIRQLVFCGLNPNSMSDLVLTDKERFFVDLWVRLEKNNPFFNNIRNYSKKGKREKSEIIQKMNKILQSRFKKGLDDLFIIPEKRNYKLILHGFYFITPEQQLFLKFLERSGFELIFFQYYDNRFPETFNFIQKFISNYYQWTDNWQIQDSTKNPLNSIGCKFLESFEKGKLQSKYNEKKKIMAYDSFYDFLNAVIVKHYPIGSTNENLQNDTQIIATNADILNTMLLQYYPEKFADRRNFLNYPVGQFFLKIHEMWQNKKIVWNRDILMTVFTSGWLTDQNTKENARDYTFEMEQLLPFFEDCQIVDDWLDRMELLLNIYESVLPLFQNEKDNRLIESIRSPFSRLSYLSVELHKVKQIQSFMLILKKMANDLFDLNKEETTIEEHFNRLLKLMRQHNPINSKVIQLEEKKIIQKLESKLAQIDDNNKFLYEDVSQAIKFYLSGKFSQDDDVFIKPFIEVDGEAFKTSKRKVYLTGLDEQGLPLSEFSTPWPLQEETYRILGARYDVLGLDDLRNQSVKKISRYLLFMALEFLGEDQLELSWMRNFLDRENLQPAVYIQYFNHEIEDYAITDDAYKNNEKQNKLPLIDFSSALPNETEFNQIIDEYMYEDLLAEYELCPRRFYYGYIVDRYATFSDDFMHQFIYGEIVNVVKRTTDQDDQRVIEMVGKLFPQWTTFKKINRAKRSLKYAGNGNENLEQVDRNMYFSTTRKKLQFPGIGNNRDNYYNKVTETKRQKEIYEAIKEPTPECETLMEAKPGYNCRFCPFLDICPEGRYAIDERKR